MNNRAIALAGIAILMIVGAYFALSMASGPANSPEPQVKQIRIKLTETDDEAHVWVPSTIYLEKGDNCELVVINGDDDDEHRLLIPSFGVETDDIPPANGQDILVFTADEEGTHAFYDPLTPEWGSIACSAEQSDEDSPCIPPGQIIVEP
jgi:hypothetical protein